MKYPIGVQNFESLRRDGYLYIDKTELIYKLVSEGRYYFLSRPRRFGKSLLISTLEAYFQGKKELFKGLAIDTLEKEWTARPVLHIDLNARQYENADSLRQEINKHLELWETAYNSPYGDRALEERFYHVIRLAHEQTGHRVAILVDEYDKPLLHAIGNKPLQEEYRNILKPFYLKDISMLPQYASLCGLTESEIHRYMEEGIQNLAATQHLTYDGTCRKLKVLYDGYHFSPGSEGIYNPFSILRAMDSGIFGSYWFETGTPTYLVTLLKQGKCDLSEMASAVTDVETLDSIYGDDEPIPVIYQSGYLTIKFMADTPYELIRDQELHYQNVMFIVSKLLGFYVQTEYRTSRGRIDLLLQTDKYVYIMEFKLEGSAEEALKQIEDRNYAAPFASDSRKVLKIGINFSAQSRNIDKWIVAGN